MPGRVIEIQSDAEFEVEMTNAGQKLVVVDFFATWCGPCRTIAPIYAQLSEKHPDVVFLKVDVDICEGVTATHSIQAMPTFMFFRNRVRLDLLRGADAATLESMVRKWSAGGGEDPTEPTPVKGHMDLTSFISKAGCECLNEADNHTLGQLLSGETFLESDCDEQLIITITFNQPVKLHSLRLVAPADKGPKDVKLFVNQTTTLDFDSAESREPLQTLSLNPEKDLAPESVVPLKFVKLQNVLSATLFVRNNQEDAETTVIKKLVFFGSPVQATNMSDFKRVAGKPGESHG